MSIKLFFQSLFSSNPSTPKEEEPQTISWLGRKINWLKESSLSSFEAISNFFRNLFNFSANDEEIKNEKAVAAPKVSYIPTIPLLDEPPHENEEALEIPKSIFQVVDKSCSSFSSKLTSRDHCKRFYSELNQVMSMSTPEEKFQLLRDLVEKRTELVEKFREELKKKRLAEIKKESIGKVGNTILGEINQQKAEQFEKHQKQEIKTAYSGLSELLFGEEFLKFLTSNISDVESLIKLTNSIKDQEIFSSKEKKLIIPTILYKIKDQILQNKKYLSSINILFYLDFLKKNASEGYQMNGAFFDPLSVREEDRDELGNIIDEEADEVEELDSRDHDFGMSILHSLAIVKSLKNEPDLEEIQRLIQEGNLSISSSNYVRVQRAWMLFIHKLDSPQIEEKKEILTEISKQLGSASQVRTIFSLREFSKRQHSAEEYIDLLKDVDTITKNVYSKDPSYQALRAAWRSFAAENVLIMEKFDEHQREKIDEFFDVLGDRFESSAREFLVPHAKAYEMLKLINKPVIDLNPNIAAYREGYPLIENIQESDEFFPLISNLLDDIKAKQSGREKELYGFRQLRNFFNPFAQKFGHPPLMVEGTEDLKTMVIELVKGTGNENILSPRTEAERIRSIQTVCILTDCLPEEAEAIVNQVPEL